MSSRLESSVTLNKYDFKHNLVSSRVMRDSKRRGTAHSRVVTWQFLGDWLMFGGLVIMRLCYALKTCSKLLIKPRTRQFIIYNISLRAIDPHAASKAWKLAHVIRHMVLISKFKRADLFATENNHANN